MIGLFLFVSLGYYVMSSNKPFHAAATYAVITGLLGLVFGGSIGAILIYATILFIYASIVYYLLDSFGDGIFMSMIILLFGALGVFFLPIILS